MSVKIGQTIDERYRITARIGHGGMSEVYEAHDIITRKTVAIKFMREDIMSDPTNLNRFTNEVRIASSLNNPNIVKVYNSGFYNDRPYIVIEYIKGQTLKEVLDFRGFLPIKEAIDVMIQLTSALSYAHMRNIIHRDIKPDNIFYMTDGTIKLGDFGIAENNIKQSNQLNKEIVGSVHYLAPEISAGKPASVLSDIYALGVTFFELITGKLPFQKKKSVDVAIAHIKEKFPSPRKYLPECPIQIEKIIMKCTAKKGSERYKNMDEIKKELVELKEHPELLKEKKSLIAKIFGFK